MTTLDKILTFLAACVGALAAADPFGLPTWVQAVAAILVVGFAAIGIVGAPSWTRGRRGV